MKIKYFFVILSTMLVAVSCEKEESLDALHGCWSDTYFFDGSNNPITVVGSHLDGDDYDITLSLTFDGKGSGQLIEKAINSQKEYNLEEFPFKYTIEQNNLTLSYYIMVLVLERPIIWRPGESPDPESEDFQLVPRLRQTTMDLTYEIDGKSLNICQPAPTTRFQDLFMYHTTYNTVILTK